MHLRGLPTRLRSNAPAVDLESRPDLQKTLRKARKKAARRKHRWRRRILYALSFIVFVAAAGAGGIYFYARYRFDEIPKIHSKHLVKQAAKPGQPFNVLLVGSDSRAFVSNPTQIKAFGNEADAGGQRSDVTMVARFVPATKSVTVISIPRDLWVDIPQNSSDISGMNRINAAFNSGPDLLIQTIEDVLHIPINHYISVGFAGFSGMVNALGGVTMDFPTAVKDAYTGLDVTTTGCQVINGTMALQLVRSRHLQYVNSNGYWEYDGLSDFSRIQRQDSFFRAVLAKVNTSITNPLAINGFISAAVGNLAIDDTLTEGDLFHMATAVPGVVLVTLDHRDAAHHQLRHRRRRRRPPGRPALRRPDDRRVQPARRAQAQAVDDDHDGPTPGQQRGLGGRPQRLRRRAAGHRHGRRAQRQRLRDHRHQQRTEPHPGR